MHMQSVAIESLNVSTVKKRILIKIVSKKLKLTRELNKVRKLATVCLIL